MNKFLVILGIIEAMAIVCQWFVFVSIRMYLFGKRGAITRKVAYPVLIFLGILNLAVVLFMLNTNWLPPDTYQRKVISVVFFSYLGIVMVMSLFFLALGAFCRTLNLTGAAVAMIKRRIGRARSYSQSVAGDAGREESSAVETTVSSDPSVIVSKGLTDSCHSATLHKRSEHRSSCASLPPSPSRRAFLKWSTAAGLVGVVWYAGDGVAQAYQEPVVDEFPLFLPQLIGLSKPITLIQITDFHFGLFLGTPEVKNVIDQTNSIDGDMVLITGDVFHSRLSPVKSLIPLLKKLRPRRLGNFVVLGNHDFYAGEQRSVAALEEGGLKLLRDQWVTLDHHGCSIHLGGIDDPRANWMWGREFPGFHSFAAKAPSSPGVRILLSHRPSVLPLASMSNIDLVLAGHTHGGQVIVPTGYGTRGLSIARLVFHYTHGWYRQGGTRMYLNRGVGLTFVPWRINCPPEIAVIHLLGTDSA